MSDRDLTHLVGCHNPAEAGALREFLADHGVFSHVQGEHHAALYGSIMVDLRVLVPADQLEEARELLQAFQAATPLEPLPDEDEEGVTALAPNPPRAELVARGRGNNPKAAVALALVPSFGAAHFYSGARKRGLFLAAVQTCGVALLFTAPIVGVGLIAAAVLIDAGDGAVCASINRDENAAPLPAARVLKRD